MAPAEGTSNKLDFLPRVSFLPLEWRSLGAAWGSASSSTADSQAVTGRCSFTVRQGFDPLEQSTTGRVVEGHSDVGVAIKVKTFALALTAGNLHFRTGLDDPHSQEAIRVGETSMPSLKLTAAKEFGDCGDSFVAFSYDVKQRRPELSAAWSATARTDRATLMLKADPIMRTLTIGAGVTSPGPEWRRTYYDEATQTLDIPQDDGERHSMWVSHTAREKEWLASTRVGLRLSLHRALNWLGDFVDYRLEEHIPMFVWRVPLTQQLYKLLVPEEDDDSQVGLRARVCVGVCVWGGGTRCMASAEVWGRAGGHTQAVACRAM